ncbi:hypothetical protein WME93_07335 [Sorangium sp. So ce1000]
MREVDQVDLLPVPPVHVGRPHAPEHARAGAHRAQLPSVLGAPAVAACRALLEVREQLHDLLVGEDHGLQLDLSHLRELRLVDRVLGHQPGAPSCLEQPPHRRADVVQRLLAPAGENDVVEDGLDVLGEDVARELGADARKRVVAQALLVVARAHDRLGLALRVPRRGELGHRERLGHRGRNLRRVDPGGDLREQLRAPALGHALVGRPEAVPGALAGGSGATRQAHVPDATAQFHVARARARHVSPSPSAS